MSLTKEQLEYARRWLAECAWNDVESADEFWTEYSDAQIERGIEKHYFGGAKQFAQDGAE